MSDKRPNILFLMSDEHRFDLLGYAGNSIVRTPVLDRLARDAVVFNNCYTPSPICIPARQSMMAGQLPVKCGCTCFDDDLTPDYMTFAKRFAQYGYQTVACGKLHHHGFDMYQGWNLRIGHDNEKSPHAIEGLVKSELERHRPAEPQWWNWSKEIRRAGIGRSPHQTKDEYAVLGALNYIDDHFVCPYYDHHARHSPLLLKVSLRLPHYPFLTDEEKFSYYLNRVPVWHRQEVYEHPRFISDWERIDPELSQREVTRATAAYYGMVESIDTMYGQVINRLEQVGEDLEDWIIVFTSDHGDLIGEHGLWTKFKYYEGSVRVPMFIRWPKRFTARRVQQNASILDLFATLCDLCEIPAPDNLDSRSLKELMRGNATAWDNCAISQLNDTCMVKQDNLKYLWLGEGYEEVLFDLAADPGETRNLIASPDYSKQLQVLRAKARSCC